MNPTQSIIAEYEINRAAQDAALKILPEAAKRIHSPWPEFMQLLVDTFKQGVDFARNTYTEPETKSTEDMETKRPVVKENLTTETKDYPPYLDRPKTVVETPKKELNLCELLKGHEGEYFYAPICGTEIELKKIRDTFIVFNLDKEEGCTIECDRKGQQYIGTIDDCGEFSVISYPNGHCMVFPSRTLYEQYPLDPYTAWMEWKEKQNKHLLRFVYRRGDDEAITEFEDVYFRTRVDREQAVEVIGAFLTQIPKSKSVASLCEDIKAIIEKNSRQ